MKQFLPGDVLRCNNLKHYGITEKALTCGLFLIVLIYLLLDKDWDMFLKCYCRISFKSQHLLTYQPLLKLSVISPLYLEQIIAVIRDSSCTVSFIMQTRIHSDMVKTEISLLPFILSANTFTLLTLRNPKEIIQIKRNRYEQHIKNHA